jgi:hypothetical protein
MSVVHDRAERLIQLVGEIRAHLAQRVHARRGMSAVCASRSACSACLRAVMSFAVTRNATGAPKRLVDTLRLSTMTVRTVAGLVVELALPGAGPQELARDLRDRLRGRRLQQLVRRPTERLLCLPSVERLGAATPVDQSVVLTGDADRVVCDIEQVGPLVSESRRALHRAKSRVITTTAEQERGQLQDLSQKAVLRPRAD